MQNSIINPFGYGWGSEVQVNGIGSHNIFIEAMIQFGFVSFILIVLVYISFIKDIAIILKYSNNNLEIGVALGGIIMLIASLTLGVLEYRQFWFFMGLVYASAYKVKTSLFKHGGIK